MPKDDNDEDSSTGTSAGSSKRVIQPLADDGTAKPTLEELLAREEAKDITTGSVKPTVGGTPTSPLGDTTPPPAPGSSTPPSQPGATNPHDIAL
jgi:hypothetical protein